MGSPTVPPLRAFAYEDTPSALKPRHEGKVDKPRDSHPSQIWRTVVVAMEFTLGMAVIVDITYASFQLGLKTIASWSADCWWHFLL